MVVLANVLQSALLLPDLVVAEMKAVGVMLEKATCIIMRIPCSTKSMSKPRRLVAAINHLWDHEIGRRSHLTMTNKDGVSNYKLL